MGKRYDKEFNGYAVKMVVEDGKTMAEVARKFDIASQTLNRWVKTYKEQKEDGFVGSGDRTSENQVKYEKDKRIRDLEEENAILKKAMGIFAKNQK